MEINILEIINYIWKNKKSVLKWAISGAAIGVVIAFSIPKQYEASISFVNENSNTKMSGSASALASMMGVNQLEAQPGINEELYPTIIRSTPFLMEFANLKVENSDGEAILLKDYMTKHQAKAWWNYILELPNLAISLFKDKDSLSFENSQSAQRSFCNALANSISMEMGDENKIAVIKSEFQDPNIALSVVYSLHDKLNKYINDYKTRRTRLNLESNQLMLNQAKATYFEADQKYALAADRNINIQSQVAQIKLDRLNNEKNLAYQIYSQIASQVESDKIKLQEQTYISTIIEPAKYPLFASSPNKKLIVFGTTFLSIIVMMSVLLIKFFKTTK